MKGGDFEDELRSIGLRNYQLYDLVSAAGDNKKVLFVPSVEIRHFVETHEVAAAEAAAALGTKNVYGRESASASARDSRRGYRRVPSIKGADLRHPHSRHEWVK